MKCEVTCFSVPVDPMMRLGPARLLVRCDTHNMNDFATVYAQGDLCPVGKVEQAVEDGLAKIAAAMAPLVTIKEGDLPIRDDYPR